MTDTVSNINLEKVCAEYGFDLIMIPCKITVKTEDLIKSCNSLEEFKNQKYHNLDQKEQDFINTKLIDKLVELQRKTKKENDFKRLKENSLNFQPDIFENEITKALGILIEDGPFAYFIWLKSQDKEPHRAMLIQTARLLKDHLHFDIDISADIKDTLEFLFVHNISSDLNMLILAKTVIERMLIYARYKAKAMQKEQGE